MRGACVSLNVSFFERGAGSGGPVAAGTGKSTDSTVAVAVVLGIGATVGLAEARGVSVEWV